MLFLACWLIPEEKYVYASSLKCKCKSPADSLQLKHGEDILIIVPGIAQGRKLTISTWRPHRPLLNMILSVEKKLDDWFAVRVAKDFEKNNLLTHSPNSPALKADGWCSFSTLVTQKHMVSLSVSSAL